MPFDCESSMKQNKILIILMLLPCVALSTFTAAGLDIGIDVDIDYGTFLNRSDLVWEWDGTAHAPVPNGWWGMAFTGNGLSGAMVTAGNETAADMGSLRVELGRTDVEDDRMPGSRHYIGETTKCDRPRLPIGYFQLNTTGKVLSGSMRLSLWNAEITGMLRTTKGTVSFTVITHALKELNVINTNSSVGEAASA